MKKHSDRSLENSKQLCKDIKSSKDETSIDSEKPKDPHSDGLDELHKPLTVGVDKMKLKNTILNDNHKSFFLRGWRGASAPPQKI